MIQLEKRRLIWSLHLATRDITAVLSEGSEKSSVIEMTSFMDILSSLGYDTRSDSLTEILRLAIVDGNSRLDTSLLFHVISEAVRKVRERNMMFWNTVITVSSSTIAWVDFRRKLSRWLSANDVNISQVKSLLVFAQEKVDRYNTGVVRKEDFISFCEDIMGVDCLLSPDITLLSTMVPVRKQRSAARIQPTDSVSLSSRLSVQARPVPIPTTTSIPVVDLRIIPRIPDKAEASDTIVESKSSTDALKGIRSRLGSQAFVKLFHSRMRYFFLLSNWRKEYAVDKKVENTSDFKARDNLRARLIVASVRSVMTRLILSAFNDLRSSVSPCSLVDEDLSAGIENAVAVGPSWTVTIQAVAVMNLIGVFRAALMRQKIVGYFTIRTGHCLDENYSLRMVSWAQSKQGRKDGKEAQERMILQPIPENSENLGTALEFDLSS